MPHLLLAIDTSGKNGSIALARVTPGQRDVEIVEVLPLTGGAFSAQLVPEIAALLEKHQYGKSDLGHSRSLPVRGRYRAARGLGCH